MRTWVSSWNRAIQKEQHPPLCRAHTARLPPDLLWLEWFQGRAQETWDTVRGHPLYVYHKNLLDHIGMHSSFAIRPDRLPFPRCYESMSKVWSIHPLERFNVSLSSASA